jgi:transcriptional regulator with XRE-family HTH domain
MKQPEKIQPIDPYTIFAELKRRKITGRRLAKKLRRSPGAITHALQGKSAVLLQRIYRYLNTTSDRTKKENA